MSGGEPELGPAAAYSAQVAAWLTQAYHAQMIQIGFPSFLAYQASIGRLSAAPPPPQQNINLNLNIPGMGMNINLGNNVPNVPVLRATLVQVQGWVV